MTARAVLRGLAAIYVVAYASLAAQVLPLLGRDGLTPVVDLLDRLADVPGAVWKVPTIFHLGAPDAALLGGALAGLVLALAALYGRAGTLGWFVLWALYLSYVDVGQVWYGYGWEFLLLEAGFLAIFLAPLRPRPSPLPAPSAAAPLPVLWLFRWLAARLMLGAGLIKLRGADCWRELTCLDTHFETQPLPNPLSPWFHGLPRPVLHAGVAVNHVVELAIPLLLLGPRRVREPAAIATILFQLTLVLSGNLSFLNWLTIAICLSCFDDATFARLVRLTRRPTGSPPPTRFQRGVSVALVLLIATLSVPATLNLLSSRQVMNGSFDPLHLVNTYGAFGSVNEERDEIVLQGTLDDPADPAARWRDYELWCKPGAVDRRPCVIAPFQPRLDWQMWFAAFQTPDQHPWLVHLMVQLLRGDALPRTLFAVDPFDGAPPRAVRAERYRYRFATGDEPGWWVRERVGSHLRAFTLDDPDLQAAIAWYGWR